MCPDQIRWTSMSHRARCRELTKRSDYGERIRYLGLFQNSSRRTDATALQVVVCSWSMAACVGFEAKPCVEV